MGNINLFITYITGFMSKIIDGKDHLLGRLASIVAKKLLEGTHICVLRCEKICISGSFFRNKIRFRNFLRKRMNTNPRRGPFHSRSPSSIFIRTVRGMLPYKTQRGAKAFMRLKCYEGIPWDMQNEARKACPDAYRILRLKPERKYTCLSRISSEHGWKNEQLLNQLEKLRKQRKK